jgi:hypothetical protein
VKMLDLFAGRCGWSKAFVERGWMALAVDLTMPTMTILEGIDYQLMDVLTITPEWIAEQGFDFICASSPCEQFSVHGMKHFHPNPAYPEMGLKLFNHTRMLCETSGLPYVMENVRSAQAFVGNAINHCGPFYLWGNAVPPLVAQNIKKGIDVGSSKNLRGMTIEEKRIYRSQFIWNQAWPKSEKRGWDTANAATIPPELAISVVDYAERIIEQRRVA